MYTHQFIGILVLLLSWQSCDGNIFEFNSKLNIASAREATEHTSNSDQRKKLEGRLNVFKAQLESLTKEQAVPKERYVT